MTTIYDVDYGARDFSRVNCSAMNIALWSVIPIANAVFGPVCWADYFDDHGAENLVRPVEALQIPGTGTTVGLYRSYFDAETEAEADTVTHKIGIQHGGNTFIVESDRESMATEGEFSTVFKEYGLSGDLGCGSFKQYLICDAAVTGLNYSRLTFLFHIRPTDVGLLDTAYVDYGGLKRSSDIEMEQSSALDGRREIEVSDLDNDGVAEIGFENAALYLELRNDRIRPDFNPSLYTDICADPIQARYGAAAICAYLQGRLGSEELQRAGIGLNESAYLMRWIHELGSWKTSGEPMAKREAFAIKRYLHSGDKETKHGDGL